MEEDGATLVQEDGATLGDAALSTVGAMAEQATSLAFVCWAKADTKTTSKL